MNIRMVLLDGSTLGVVDGIRELSKLGSLKSYDVTSAEETIERVKGYDVVITNKVIIDENVMQACPELKLICITATGTNNVDLDYASKCGIQVKNVAGYSTDSVVQTTFSLLLSLLMKINYFDNYVKSGGYSESPIFTNHGASFFEIKGKQLGIVGLGTIGKKVAEIARIFGAEVVYYSTSGKNSNGDYKQVSFSELLATSDIISIHCPLNIKTENLFGLNEFKQMKKNAIILNTGRGKIINEYDLAEALQEGLISAAGLDVLSNEPILKDNPLMKINDSNKLIVTPHIAWISKEARESLIRGVVNNIKEWSGQNS